MVTCVEDSVHLLNTLCSPVDPPRVFVILSHSQKLDALSKVVEAVNRKRKSEQVSNTCLLFLLFLLPSCLTFFSLCASIPQLAVAPTLAGLESDWLAQTYKNNEIEAACFAVEAHLKKYKAALEAHAEAAK
jgi:hypothetical protein